MALLFMDGFDAGDYAQKWTNNPGGGRLDSTTRYSNGSCAYSWNDAGFVKTIPASTTIYLGFAYRQGAASPHNIAALRSDNNATTQLTIGWSTTTTMGVRLGAGGFLATGTMAIPAGTWIYIELSATIADAGGSFTLKIDGNTLCSFTGDTRNGGTSALIDTIALATNAFQGFYDDVYICDGTGSAPYNTFLGDIRIKTLTPTAAGTTTQFTPSTGANYTTVDELPYSASDYVSASTSGTRDTYAMADIAAGYTVLAVQNNIVAKKLDAGGTAIKPAIVSGGTVYYGANKTLTASDATASDLRTVDPATSAAWTVPGVNALEAGVEIV